MKNCNICKEEKQSSEFYTREDRGYVRLSSSCKPCHRTQRAEYIKKNPEAQKNGDLRKFGISLTEYNQMWAAQSGCCAICDRHSSEFKRNLAVDHKHSDGQIRGLLCTNCNTAIGKFQDSPQLLFRAIEYLTPESLEMKG